MRTRHCLTLLVISAALVACGNRVSGTYTDDAGVTRYTFAGNGAVTIHVLGAEVDAEYSLDGDKVLVSSAQGTVVLLRRDGRLYGPMGLELIRQSHQPKRR
ncbi:MAG: hypothetical protein EX272_05815 [Chromatiales bacterium]|nr:MAG: hypothetical protein EX272_05815 [Chromatiales bacterium]